MGSMRKFYEVMVNPDLEGFAGVSEYELNGFDLFTLIDAKKCDQSDLDVVRISLSKGDVKHLDFIGAPIPWPIISDRFFNLIKQDILHDIEVLSPPIFLSDTNDKVDGYHLINILSLIDCVDMSRSVIDEGPTGGDFIYELYVDPKKIPDDVNIFRVPNSDGQFMISEDVLRKISGQGLTGLVVSEVS